MRKRGDELITLPNLKQKDPNFKGPYQVPSTSIFNEFHDLLSSAYGIGDAVTKGTVLSITPRQLNDDDEAMFEVVMQTPTNDRRIVKTKRVVCALGPMFRPWKCLGYLIFLLWLLEEYCILTKSAPSLIISKSKRRVATLGRY